MHQQHGEALLAGDFYTIWNQGVEFLEKFEQVITYEQKIEVLNLAKIQFFQAKSFCHHHADIEACNDQLALIFDKIIEIYARNIDKSNPTFFENLERFILAHIEELTKLLEHGVRLNASQILAKVHYNIGVIYFGLIDELDHMNKDFIKILGGTAKGYLETAKTFSSNQLEIEKCQHMIARVNFDVAGLMRYDLKESFNLGDFAEYYAWYKQALVAYEQDSSLCSKEAMFDLTKFTVAVATRYYYSLHRFYISHFLDSEIPSLRKSILLISRKPGTLNEAKMWKSLHDNFVACDPVLLDRTVGLTIEAGQIEPIQFQSLSHQSIFANLCLSNLQLLAKEININSCFK